MLDILLKFKKVKAERRLLTVMSFLVKDRMNRLFNWAIDMLCYIVALLPGVFLLTIYPFKKVRFFMMCSNRIGHYAMNTEMMLCALDQKDVIDDHKIFYYIAPRNPLCNKQLYVMWKRVIPILPFPRVIEKIDRIFGFILGKQYNNASIKYFSKGAGAHDVKGYLANCATHLIFLEKEEVKGNALLAHLGVPAGAPFVCLHVRDSTYLKAIWPSKNWCFQSYRDANIENHKKSALFLAEQGYYVIRMGKYVGSPFDLNHPQIIDYANSKFSSDFLDIYLSAKCDFFIGNSSGLDAIPQVFRRPVLTLNEIPFFDTQSWYPVKLFIPKNLRDIGSGRLLTLKETVQIFLYENREMLHKGLSPVLSKLRLQFVENTEDEILEVVKEMVLRLKGDWQETQESEMLQKKVWSFFPLDFEERPGYFKHGHIHVRMGSAFLSKYKMLLS